MQANEPRQVIVEYGVPGWLRVLREFNRRTRRGLRRLWHGCWPRHSPDLLRRQEGGRLYLDCPACSLQVREALPDQVPKVRPWDEARYQRSLTRDNVLDGAQRFTK